MNLTRKQTEVLAGLAELMALEGKAPTLQELGDHCGIKAKAQVHTLLEALEDYGMIASQRYTQRGRSLTAKGLRYLQALRDHTSVCPVCNSSMEKQDDSNGS
ncbi:MAG: hypothetical protein NXI16_01545 [Alphaproteobacteria bacterium]|nr:hypothetical protein [Alphaproteobacteria bacterium]